MTARGSASWLSRYCYAIAARDVDTVVRMFSKGCRVEILGQTYEGEAGLRELYRTSLAGGPKPTVQNHLLDSLEVGTARGRAVFTITQTVDGEARSNAGCYEDCFVKSNGEWKFQSRTFQVY